MAVLETTDTNFENDVLKNEKLVLVDFWAPWCGPCQALAPTLDALATKVGEGVQVVKVNIDDNPGTASQYGVRSIPTMVLFKEGQPVSTKVGAQTLQALEEWVSQA